jgi:ring-1,2-phenylacetyl-CoA epoxidase subunit PaaC
MNTAPGSSSSPLRPSAERPGGDPVNSETSLFQYTLGLADDALVSAQRMGWWISRAPELEEDVALANIGLDQLGQARALLTYAGRVEGAGRTEDDLAYLRDDREFRNVKLVERPMTDFGVAMARLLVVSTYQSHLYAGLQGCADETLAAIAGKAVKEVTYHVDHASHWVLRLGDGTDESHVRMQRALAAEWPYLDELFTPFDQALTGRVVDPAALRGVVLTDLARVVEQATLTVPDVPPALGGGREGLHTEHLGHLLAEMQHLHRSHPGATW